MKLRGNKQVRGFWSTGGWCVCYPAVNAATLNTQLSCWEKKHSEHRDSVIAPKLIYLEFQMKVWREPALSFWYIDSEQL